MFEKSFVTDCEGPLTLNDNAYEMCAHFIKDGDQLFKILSSYDDYLVDVVKKDNYKSGNTLKLVLPFFVGENITDNDFTDFSKNNIHVVGGAKFLLEYLKNAMNTYIVSTSYGHYIEALSHYMNFPFKNTFYTDVDISELSLNDEDLTKIKLFKNQILDNPNDYELFDDIFFSEIPEMSIYEKIKSIDVVGGLGKKIAIGSIIDNDNINPAETVYVGDSITDVEPLEFIKNKGGISISFNGNEYPLRVAEIAIVSESAITTAVIANVYLEFNKDKVLEFINDYNNSNNLGDLFDEYNIDFKIKDEFFEFFNNGNYPLIEIINEDNYDEILKLSTDMRNNIRGFDIGGLG